MAIDISKKNSLFAKEDCIGIVFIMFLGVLGLRLALVHYIHHGLIKVTMLLRLS